MNTFHQNGDIIADRYCILHLLGQGGIGTTYAAEDLQTQQRVAIKVLTLIRAQDFKILELFEREAKILSQLDHPAIAKYIDYFQIDKPRDRLFYLVQQLAEGQSLASLIEKGWRPSEDEVKAIAEKILEVLIYLQALTPPIIHRDIKPQNIIYNSIFQSISNQEKSSENINSLFLVDFGAVQDVYHNSLTGGSTVVGTYGYMAPEQFRGQAVLSTDLYGLGTTLIFLLSQKLPSELPQRKLKVNFRPYVTISQDFANWIDHAIEPAIEDRFTSARQAMAVLRNEQAFFDPQYTPPLDSRIRLLKDLGTLTISVQPIWLKTKYSRMFILIPSLSVMIPILISWLSSVIFIESQYVFNNSGLSILIIALSLIGIWAIAAFLNAIASRINLTIDPEYFHYERWFFKFRIQNLKGETKHILKANFKNSALVLNRKAPIKVCNLLIQSRNYRFGCFLSEPEKEWLISEINDFLAKPALT